MSLMAPKKYLMNSKRRGYAAIIFLFGAIIFIVPTLVITFRQVMKFNDLTFVLLQQKQEKIALYTLINKSAEHLFDISAHFSSTVLVNPSSSSELLVYTVSETMGDHTLSSHIYNMNYVISDDTVISDVLDFPPSQITIAGEKYFLIKTTIQKNEIPSYCIETAIEITNSGSINEVWRREYLIY
jgi:hypothetical protein